MNAPFSNTPKWIHQLQEAIPFRVTDPLRSRDLRIGIVGTSRSGKSVLLTSLLDHLKNFDPDLLTFSRPLRIRRFQKRRDFDENHPVAWFPYETFRGQLAMEARWPLKTKAAYRFACQLQVLDQWSFWPRQMRLHWLDFPGERMADLTMGGRDYAAWSDQFWDAYDHSPVAGVQGDFFSEPLAADEATISGFARAYLRLLAHLTKAYRPLVTPSTFLLCPEGTQPSRQDTLETLIAQRPIGIRPDAPVVPLPARLRSQFPAVAKRFASNYDEYVQTIVDPLFRALSRCDRILFAVNIPEILSTGPHALNDTSDLLSRFLEASLPPEDWASRFESFVRNHLVAPVLKESWRPGGIRRVAFVATQSDRILARDCNRLLNLLHELVATPVRNTFPGLEHRTFTCAAVRAAESRGEDLVGQLQPGEEGRETLQQFTVSRLPEKWPDQWEGKDFRFPEVFPRFSPIRTRAPAQEGLAPILEYLLLP